MAGARSSNLFPYFCGFLEKTSEHPIARTMKHRAAVASSVSWIAGLAAVAIGASLFGVGGAVGAALIALVFGASAVSAIGIRASRPRKGEDSRPYEAYEAMIEFNTLSQQKKLHKWVDPVAIQLLEAGAWHYTRITDAMSGVFWSSPNLPAHWQTIRDQALVAGRSAMEELLLLAKDCIGKPAKERKDDLKGLIEGFVDLGIADALQGLKEWASSDWQKYAFQSPNRAIIWEPGRQVAEQLKALADEVERMAQQAVIERTTSVEGASSSIDVVLNELRAVQQAEEEYRQQIQS